MVRRDKKKLYEPALRGEKKNVVGVDIPFEDLGNNDFTVDTEKTDPDSAVKEIIKKPTRQVTTLSKLEGGPDSL